ncbi:MAG: hypothetical protein QGH76_05545 [Phycisphaerales bacterium]|nr:hypothetical protein [Phycisphaerales bacterium]
MMRQTMCVGGGVVLLFAAANFVSAESSSCDGLTCLHASMLAMQPHDGLPPVPRDLVPADRGPRDIRAPRRGERGERGGRPLTPEMIEQTMRVAEEVDPDLAAQLRAMCESDPDAFERLIRRQGRRLASLVDLRQSDPDLFEVKVAELKLDAEMRRVAHDVDRIRDEFGMDSSEAAASIEELRLLMRGRIAIGIRAQHLYIERLEQHVAAMRERLIETEENFDEVVEERLDLMLSPPPPKASDSAGRPI